MRSVLVLVLVAVGALAVPNGFVVRRNVIDYGAKGDGVTDDTAAFVAALTAGKATIQRPGPWNNSVYGCQTLQPSVVYVPNGTYVISATLPLTFYTQLVGKYHDRPVLRFLGNGYRCLDAGTDEGPGNGWYGNVNQNNFYHQLRNIVVDATGCGRCTAIHWQVSQATNIVNTDFLSAKDGLGLYMEDGSGGYFGDVKFVGGNKAMQIGNQQFTFRNVTVEGAYTAIDIIWNWVMTFVDLKLKNCHNGVLTATGVGTVNLIDVTAEGVDTVFGIYGHATQVNIENADLKRCNTSVSTLYETVTAPVSDYFMGRVANGSIVAGIVGKKPPRPASLVDTTTGKYFGMTRPNYAKFVTLNLTNGTDVTEALQTGLDSAARSGIAVFIPYGTYLITNTVHVPKGSRIFGEVWTRLAATGDVFSDASNPVAVLELGRPGDVGVMQLADFMFTTVGPAPGAVFLQWNIRGAIQGDCGMWDAHFRIGGAAGTHMGSAECSNQIVTTFSMPAARNCTGVHTMLHLTPTSGNIYIENTWGWVADHDVDGGADVNIFSARGFLSESRYGGVWLYGSAMEHSYAYLYNLHNASADFFIGAAQTETPYYQPQFALNASTAFTSWISSDPSYDSAAAPNQEHAYALVVQPGPGAVYVYGTGFYSFFHRWDVSHCGTPTAPCQTQLVFVNRSATAGDGRVELSLLNTHGSREVITKQEDAATVLYPAVNFPNGFCQTFSDVSLS